MCTRELPYHVCRVILESQVHVTDPNLKSLTNAEMANALETGPAT